MTAQVARWLGTGVVIYAIFFTCLYNASSLSYAGQDRVAAIRTSQADPWQALCLQDP